MKDFAKLLNDIDIELESKKEGSTLFPYDSEGNLIEDKYLQGLAAKNALVLFFIVEQQCNG